MINLQRVYCITWSYRIKLVLLMINVWSDSFKVRKELFKVWNEYSNFDPNSNWVTLLIRSILHAVITRCITCITQESSVLEIASLGYSAQMFCEKLPPGSYLALSLSRLQHTAKKEGIPIASTHQQESCRIDWENLRSARLPGNWAIPAALWLRLPRRIFPRYAQLSRANEFYTEGICRWFTARCIILLFFLAFSLRDITGRVNFALSALRDRKFTPDARKRSSERFFGRFFFLRCASSGEQMQQREGRDRGFSTLHSRLQRRPKIKSRAANAQTRVPSISESLGTEAG